MAKYEKFHEMVARVAASPKAHPALKKAHQAYMKNAGVVSKKIAKDPEINPRPKDVE